MSTFPDADQLAQIAEKLVRSGLAACVNMMPISSVYEWEGRVRRDGEYLAIFKTTDRNRKTLQKAILEAHPYDTPEIAEISVASINEPYLRWVVDSTMRAGSDSLQGGAA